MKQQDLGQVMMDHNVKGLFVTIDGVDGVGKTAICRALSKKLQAVSFKSPSAPFDDARTLVEGHMSPLTRYHFFRAATQHDSEKIQSFLDNGKNVVCDRYIHSTYAYHAVQDSRVQTIFETTGLVMPDLAVLLTAPQPVREERLARRKKRNPDYHKPLEEDTDYQNRVQQFFGNMSMFEIDTGTCTITQAAGIILMELKARASLTDLTYQ